MGNPQLVNTNIKSVELLASPQQIREEIPLTAASASTALFGRETIEQILDNEDPRLMAVVGPCSIHNIEGGLEYARRLKQLSEEVSETIYLIMRVYFEKPRSALGWKGFVNDPYMNDTFHIEEGIRMARRFLSDVAKMGLPAATEVLEALMPQYLGDLISWSVIGARTAEAQTHREIASGLSTPVGFKNGTDGSLAAAINGMRSARGAHHFLGVTEEGLPAVFSTTGNAYPHIVLRGGGGRPNYDAASIAACERELQQAGMPLRIMIDCSHANSNKDHQLQGAVLQDVLSQIEAGNRSICGIMLESNIEGGSQPLTDPARLSPYCSVTDPCIDWETTEKLLRAAHQRLLKVRTRA